MPKGPLQISVTPVANAVDGQGQFSGDFAGGPIVIVASVRPQLSGIVRDFVGNPLGNARVTVQRVGQGTQATGDGSDFALENTVGSDGSFHVHLDPGTYHVWVEPSSKSGLARVLASAVEVLSLIHI